MATTILLIIVLVLLLALGALMLLVYRRSRVEARDIEPAISRAWQDSGLDQRLGEMSAHVRDIRDTHASVEQMLRVPKERASFGELSLETILADQLPPDMFGIRHRVFDGKVPDAHIKSTVGLICIDSKFPLDNYRAMLETTHDSIRETYRKQFIRDVQGHLGKIAADYVCPDKGSAEFAFAYIPSEGVYYFLVTEAYEMLRDYARQGVQVVSPLTLGHKVELIKTGVHARKLSEEAGRVRQDILRLSRQFEEIDEVWRVLYDSHIRNTGNKAQELDQAYRRLRDEFSHISRLSSPDDHGPTNNSKEEPQNASNAP